MLQRRKMVTLTNLFSISTFVIVEFIKFVKKDDVCFPSLQREESQICMNAHACVALV
jgi:hypothetical protein